jgi:hypothetical protein
VSELVFEILVQVMEEEVEWHDQILDPIFYYPVYQMVGVSSVNNTLAVDKFPSNITLCHFYRNIRMPWASNMHQPVITLQPPRLRPFDIHEKMKKMTTAVDNAMTKKRGNEILDTADS